MPKSDFMEKEISKKRSKWWVFLLVIAVFVIGGGMVWKLFSNTPDKIQPIYLIPDDVLYFIETDTPIEALERLGSSEIWDHLQSNETIFEISESLHKLDTVFNDQKKFVKYIGNRSVYVSAHKISHDDWSHLFIVDISEYAGLQVLKNNILSMLPDNFDTTARVYKQQKIIEVTDLETYDTLYITFVKNQLVASYSSDLIHRSIDQYLSPKIGLDLNYQTLKREVKNNQDFRFYINQQQIKAFYNCFSVNPNVVIELLNKHLFYTAFEVKIDDDTLFNAKGFSNGDALTQSYITAFEESGVAQREVFEVVPYNTSFVFSFSFDDFQDFYSSVSVLLAQNAKTDFEVYTTNVEKVEKYVGIDVTRDFYGWIDQEVSLLKLNSTTFKGKQGAVVLLKASDINLAKERLQFVCGQVKRKTPLKFNKITYKAHEITYLEIKSLFKVLFGNLFEDVEKPYFTVINDYVVFSNTPKALKYMIDASVGNETLSNNERFTDFYKQVDDESHVLFYANTYEALMDVKKQFNPNQQVELDQNVNFLSKFEHLAITLTAHERHFETQALVSYDAQINKAVITHDKTAIAVAQEVKEQSPFDVKPIFPSDFTAKEYVEKFKNGQTKLTVKLKKGLLHGRLKIFYPDGQVKLSGRYKNGTKSGTWRYYSTLGDLLKKKKY